MCVVNIIQPSKENEILPFVTMWMGLINIMLSEISQRHILCDITYKWSLKIKLTDVYSKTNRFTNSEDRLVVTSEERE